jgi:tripartite-type tricarboxylate transporter receptor subunit TctC
MQVNCLLGYRNVFIGIMIFVLLSGLPDASQAQAPYFQGKTIKIIQGREPGGVGDLRVRPLVPFLKKHIPSNPTIVMEYMPGAGSRKAANYIYQSARPDGLTIGNLSSGIVSVAILGESGVQYDINKFFYLGSPYRAHHSIFVSRKDGGWNSIEKLRAASGIKIGAQSVGFPQYIDGRLFAFILGLKEPKFIPAYGGAELDPALMRGEIDARATTTDAVLQRNREWINKGLVDFHATIEVQKGDKDPLFGDLPELESFANSEKERKILVLHRAIKGPGQPFVLPPGTPRELVKILQEAFRRAYSEPEFQREYKKHTADDAKPILPEQHEKVMSDISYAPEVIELFKKLVGDAPLPTR